MGRDHIGDVVGKKVRGWRGRDTRYLPFWNIRLPHSERLRDIFSLCIDSVMEKFGLFQEMAR